MAKYRDANGKWTGAYRSYVSAKGRCHNPNVCNFKWYGGRGIKFRFSSFDEFYAELGDRPTGMTLDRIDVNGHYEPGNVRWLPLAEQQRNRRVRTDYTGSVTSYLKQKRGERGRFVKCC
jgi:hypothetical protein